MTSIAYDLVIPLQISAAERTRYQEEGWLLLPGLLSHEDAGRLRGEVLDIMESIGLGISKLRQNREYLEGSRLDAFVNSPALRSITTQLMGGDSSLYLPFTAVKSGGGGGRFHFHQEYQYTSYDGPGINLWFALNEMTPENGCLQVVPRSHISGTLKADVLEDGHRSVTHEPEDFLSIQMQPGDCLAFSRLTVHGSGPNITDAPRVAYAVQYHINDAPNLPLETQTVGYRHLPGATGVIDLPGFVGALRSVGYDGPATREPMARAITMLPRKDEDGIVELVSAALRETLAGTNGADSVQKERRRG